MGLNFADQSEANEVFELIKEKSRRNKEKLTVKPVSQPAVPNPVAKIHAVQEPMPSEQNFSKGVFSIFFPQFGQKAPI